MPTIASSSSAAKAGTAGPTSSITCWTRSRMTAASGLANRALTPPDVARNPAIAGSRVLADRGPQPVAVQGLGVALHGLPRAGRDDGLALVMDVEHQLLGLGPRVAEHPLEHVGHVGHEVHRVVPDDREPGPVDVGALAGLRLVKLHWRDAHWTPPPSALVSHSPGTARTITPRGRSVGFPREHRRRERPRGRLPRGCGRGRHRPADRP